MAALRRRGAVVPFSRRRPRSTPECPLGLGREQSPAVLGVAPRGRWPLPIQFVLRAVAPALSLWPIGPEVVHPSRSTPWMNQVGGEAMMFRRCLWEEGACPLGSVHSLSLRSVRRRKGGRGAVIALWRRILV